MAASEYGSRIFHARPLLVCLCLTSTAVGCSESDTEIAARHTIAAERARLAVVADTAKSVRGGLEGARADAQTNALAFDYRSLKAPLGAKLAMYRTPEGVGEKPGVVLLKGAGDFGVALGVAANLGPAANALVVEGIKAADDVFAISLGYSRPLATAAKDPCPDLAASAFEPVVLENQEIAAQLKDARRQCTELGDVFAALALNHQNLATRKALEGLDRMGPLRPLFVALAPLVVGGGEGILDGGAFTIKGCTKEGIDTDGLRAALGAAALAPELQAATVDVKVDACKFTLAIALTSPTSPAVPRLPAPASVGGPR